MKYIKKLNIDFNNWDNIQSMKYWYLNCYKNIYIFISYIDIDNIKKNNKVEILFQNKIYSKKESNNIFVDINKVGSKIFKIDNNDIYYLISNKENISLSDLSDEFLIEFKKNINCNINIEKIKNKIGLNV
jgi:hypothetical protein